jgi:hypothetical protein
MGRLAGFRYRQIIKPEGTLRAILKQAGITPDAFLNQR